MGSSTSKAARKLPTQASRAQQPAWAGARTPHVDPAFRQAGQAPEAPPPPKAATRTASPQGLGYSTGKLRMDRGASENMTDGKVLLPIALSRKLVALTMLPPSPAQRTLMMNRY